MFEDSMKVVWHKHICITACTWKMLGNLNPAIQNYFTS
jgi:hypothetical protein